MLNTRFLNNADYDKQIKLEIRRLLDGSAPDKDENYKLVMAEQAAIHQIFNWLSGRYNCDKIFAAIQEGEQDTRDQFMVMITIDMALYHLYSQTGNKDVPKHRQDRYQDALDWLKIAARGEINTNLPTAFTDDSTQSNIRLWSTKQENHTW